MLTETTREALQGDKLFPESIDVNLDFVPHAPQQDVDATVIAVRDLTIMGRIGSSRSIAAPPRDSKPVPVLAIEQFGGVVNDKFAKGGLNARNGNLKRGQNVQLPAERVGVSKIYRRTIAMSFALVKESLQMRQGDSRDESVSRTASRCHASD